MHGLFHLGRGAYFWPTIAKSKVTEKTMITGTLYLLQSDQLSFSFMHSLGITPPCPPISASLMSHSTHSFNSCLNYRRLFVVFEGSYLPFNLISILLLQLNLKFTFTLIHLVKEMHYLNALEAKIKTGCYVWIHNFNYPHEYEFSFEYSLVYNINILLVKWD